MVLASLEAPPPEPELAPYRPSELEAVARLLLRDREVRVIAGTWWSYYPERGEIVYPANLLEEWSANRSLGALCHEVAEVLFSGSEASRVIARFIETASRRGCDPRTALLLFNVVNDLRVNRMYLAEYPGSRRFFASVFETSGLGQK